MAVTRAAGPRQWSVTAVRVCSPASGASSAAAHQGVAGPTVCHCDSDSDVTVTMTVSESPTAARPGQGHSDVAAAPGA